MYLSIRITARLLRSEIHSQRISVRLSMLIRLLLTLCCVMVLPNPLFGQEYPAKHDNPSALQHDADIPVRGTEAERAEPQQAEGKEEALKSLVVHGPYTVLPLPVLPTIGMKATGSVPSYRFYNQTRKMNCNISMPRSIRTTGMSERHSGCIVTGIHQIRRSTVPR